ncbi:sialic acid-binding Ig-like lectin 5 isoform X2 [Danio rerio]|uniref:Sialic acid-binding Ig-like lectin 5 isoform X2 n=1 Tax=Danio rerio TaxID=7955 RepID=A0AC58J8Z6_DANRE
MMEISVTILLAGCLIQGVLCGFSISLPERVEALEGSCVFISCTFQIDQTYNAYLTDSAKRLWYKDGKDAVLVFNSSSPDSGLLTGEIFGKPTEKNCSTRFNNLKPTDNGSYFFRLEGNGGLKWSYRNPDFSQVEIVVRASPPNPTVLLFQDQQEVMEVTEGKSVTLSCSIKIFCPFHPPSLTWSFSPELLINANITEQQHQSQTHYYSDLMFTVTHHHHRAEFTCTATQQQITTHSTRQLHVQYAPKSVSAHVSPAGVIVEGHSVTLSCSSEANPAVKYSWYRHTEEDLKLLTGPNLIISNTNMTIRHTNLTISNQNMSKINLTGPNLTISNVNPAHRGRYYCRAENQHGTQNTSVLLDVQFPPKISSSCSQNDTLVCICKVDGNPLPKLQWRLSGNVLNSTEEMQISEQTVGNKSLESILSIRQSLSDSSVLQCWTANAHGSASHQFQHITTTPDTGLHPACLLLGFSVGASLVLIFCVLTVCNERKKSRKLSESRQDNASELIRTESKTLLSSTLITSETVHYSSINFMNVESTSGEIRGLSSLTEEYATVRRRTVDTTPEIDSTTTHTPEKNTSEDTHTTENNTPPEDTHTIETNTPFKDIKTTETNTTEDTYAMVKKTPSEDTHTAKKHTPSEDVIYEDMSQHRRLESVKKSITSPSFD